MLFDDVEAQAHFKNYRIVLFESHRAVFTLC